MEYNKMVEAALRGVVRQALEQTIQGGLLGDHHYYLTFRTDTPGVEVPPYLKERFKDEMTIVVQHQFWDLLLDDQAFSLTLSFNGKPEHLRVPFNALTGFFDPSVQFGLQFRLIGSEAELKAAEARANPAGPANSPAPLVELSIPADEKTAATAAKDDSGDSGNVVTLDGFRKS